MLLDARMHVMLVHLIARPCCDVLPHPPLRIVLIELCEKSAGSPGAHAFQTRHIPRLQVSQVCLRCAKHCLNDFLKLRRTLFIAIVQLRPTYHLHHRTGAIHLQHLATPEGAIAQADIHDLGIAGFLEGARGGGSRVRVELLCSGHPAPWGHAHKHLGPMPRAP